MASLPGFPGFPSPPSPAPSPPPSGGTPGVIIAVPFLDTPPPPATDSNSAANTVVEGAAVNTLVGITANSVDAEGQTVTYSLGADSSGGGFKIDSAAGVVSVADPSKIDFETAPSHTYSITVNSSDGYISTAQNFAIAVTDVAPTAPVDSNAATNSVLEGAAVNAAVGITASSTDINGPGVTYSLTGDTSGGGFKINPVTGVVTVADGTKIDFESAPGHAYTVTVQASDGTLTNSQTFVIAVADVPLSTPVDNDLAADSVAEGAANGTAVGITASAFDPNGPVTTYSLTGDTSGGGFTINAATGVVTVADLTKIDYESSGGGHSYTITVQAQDGVQTTSQTFTIGVTNVAPSAPTDSVGAANTVVEGATTETLVGLTASSLDPNGPAVTYSLTDDAGGRFAIDAATGEVKVGPNANLIDFETSGGTSIVNGSYNITVQASDGAGGTSSATFAIAVTDAPPANWTDADGSANSVVEGAANGSATGVVARAFDPNGGHVTYSFAAGGDANGAFAIDPTTGAITVADGTKIDFESTAGAGHTYTLTVQGTDDSGQSTTGNFVVNVTDVAPPQPTGSGGTVAEGATAGSPVGITAQSLDVNGGAVTYSLSNSAGGLFAIDATTGAVSVTAAGATGIDYESTAAAGHKYVVTVDASDGTASSSANFTIDVTNTAPSQPTDSDGVAGGSIALNAADGTPVGITFASTDPNGGPVTYSLTGSTAPAGTFVIDPNTGVVTLAAGHPALTPATTYTVTGVANDGLVDSPPQTFNIFVANNALNVDLDSSDNTATGNNYAATYIEQAAALAVTDTDDVINNTGNPGVTTATSAKVVLTNAQTGDALTVNGSAATSGSLVIGGETINFTKTASAGAITVDLTGSASYAHYQTALHDIAFSNAGDAPNTTARIIDVTVTDSTGTSPVAVATIGVTPVNDAPVLTLGPAGAASYTEKNSATALFSTGSVVDPDAPANFNGGSFTVQITGKASAGDQIVLTGSGFSVSGSSILLGGTTIGSIHAGTGLGTSLVTIDLNASATSGVVNQMVDAFGFQSSSNNPATADRTVSFTFNDGGNTGGGALASNTVTQTVHVIAVNDAPVASNGTASGNEDNPISGAAVATDVDSPILTYSLVNANGGAQHGTVTFTNAATGAYTYTPNSNYNGTDTFTFKANDGSLDSNNATITVTVNPVNDAPVLAANASTAPAFTEKGAATQLLSAGTVTDPDNPADFTGGGLTVAIQSPQTGDQIVVLASSGFSIADDGVGGLTLILNGHSIGTVVFGAGSATVSGLTAFATPAVVNQMVEAFGYQNPLDNFDTTSRHVDFTFNDGGNTGGGALASNTLTQTITLTAVNDAPVNHVPTTAQTVAVGANLVFSNGDGNAISVTDDDANGASETVTLTAGTGTLTLNGIAGLSFTTGDGTADTTMTFSGTLANINNALAGLTYTDASAGSDVITMTTNDGGNSGIGGALQDSDTVHIAVTTAPPVEPSIDLNGAGAGTGFTTTFTEAGAAVGIVDPAVTIVDTGAGDAIDVIATATITLVNHQANDVLSVNGALLPAGVTASAYNAATGVLTLTGSGTSTAADFQNALQAISFSSPGADPATVDRTITISVNDGTTDSNTALATIHVTAVNNAPALDLDADNNHAAGSDFATDYSANGAAVAIADTDVSITDPDNTTLASATAVLTNAKTGDILSISGALPPGITATTTAGAGTITVTLTGSATLADYQNALKQIGFSNSSDAPDQTARDISVTVNDGTADSNVAHTTITTHPVNHPPVAQNGSASGNEDNAISGSVIATDVDGNTLTYGLVNANGGALHGTVVITDTATGAYTYTPNQDFFGTDSFQFKANDGSLDSNSGTVSISVAPVNDPPVLDLDSATSVGTNGDDFATAYTISGAAAAITGTALITDVDDTNNASATVTLTNAQSNDVLTINGALPGGIVATTDTSVAGVITVHLTGSATHAQYQAALHQIVFSNGLASPDQTSPDRVITVVVNDGEAANSTSNTATTTIHLTQDTAPVANAKTASATEAGGVNNGTAGSNGTGNVITDAVADSDAEDQTSALVVSAIAHGASPGSVGNLLAGDFGSLTLNTDGSYSYLVDNANTTVQALRLSTDTLIDSFTYTIRDSAGLTSSNTLVVTIHGADDAPVAVADVASATEAGGVNNGIPGVNPTGNALTNDTDVDTGDGNAVQGVAAGTQAGPLSTNVATDVTGSFGKLNVASDGSYTYTVDNTNTSVQALRTSAQTLTDTFSYTERDTAGATSTTQITVTIHGQNDNPTAVADSASATEAGGTNNGTAGSNATGNVLTNDTDPDSVANGETQTLQGVEAGSHLADTVTTGAGSAISGAHGALTLNTNGSFTYVVNNADSVVDALNTGQSTTDTFTYTMHDAANATSTAVLTVTINGADDAPVAVSQGSAASPAYNAFDAVALNVAASGVKTGATDVDNTFASLNAVKDTNPAHGTATVNSDGSFTYTATSGYFGNDSFNYHVTDPGGLSSNSATAFISVTPHVAYIDNTASAVGEDGSLAHPFASIADFNTANTIANHFDIIYVEKGTGTYTAGSGITLLAGQTLEGQGVDPSYVRGDNGQTVVLHDFDNTAGSIATISVSSGAAVTLNSGNTIQGLNITESGSGAGIIDNGSSVGTFNMSGVHITTGAGAGLSLTHGGTVNATTTVGTNSITSTTGTALNITNTNIGAGNVTFHDISASGGVNGIVLNNTGTSGHLAVTGTGTTAGSGGTIQNTTGDSISLTSTQDVNLADMNVSGSKGYGIIGHTVNGIVLSHDSVSGSGDSTANDGEGNIYLYELTGNASHATTFDSLSVTNAYVHNVFIENTAGTLTDLQVTNSTFSNNGASTHAGDEFEINLASGGLVGSPTATVHATHDTFSGNLSTPSTFTATGFAGSADDGTLNLHIGDGTAGGLNTFDTNDSGITVNATNTGNINFDINDNTVNHNRAVGITANNQGSGVLTGFIRNNVVGQQGVQDSGAAIGAGIDIDDEGTGAGHVTTLAITNNIVQSVGDTSAGLGFQGVNVLKQSGSQNTSGVFNLTLTGNTIRDIWNDRGLLIEDSNNAGNSTMNLNVSGNTFSNANAQGGNTTARIGGAPAGTDHVNVTQASAAALAAANGLTASNAPGNNMRVDTNVFFNQAAPALPPATPQLALNGQGPGSTDTLTMDQLAPLLLAAVQHWADAGASAAQIALLENTHIFISDLPNSGILANTDSSGITIDTNGAGWGWFIDPTPGNNSEFGVTMTPHDFTATSGDAASHIDLLTVLEHEMGHVLGLEDSSQPGIMNVNLDTGERREPDAADVAQADATLSSFQTVEPTAPPPPAPASTTSATSTAGQTFDAGQGGHILVGTAGPDSFVFANVAVHAPTPPPVTVIENYNFAQGDKFDFSAITSQFHGSAIGDAQIVRAVEDASGKFATLQVDTFDPRGLPGPMNWVNVAQIDGAHAGDAVNVLIDGAAVHLTQLHVGLLA